MMALQYTTRIVIAALHFSTFAAGQTCNVGDNVKCPDNSGAWCMGQMCCPGSGGERSYPCPSAPAGWGPGKCQESAKRVDCLKPGPPPKPTPAPPPTPPPTPSPPWPDNKPYECSSPFEVKSLVAMEKKGFCLDDTTFEKCPNKLFARWPNLHGRPNVTSLRLFKSWHPRWGGDDARHKAWEALTKWVFDNNAKVLIGTQVTCNGPEDDMMWKWDLELMKMLGPDHVMGLAVGNEMDIFWRQCGGRPLSDLWNWRYWQLLQQRVEAMDNLDPGFKNVKITIVWAMSVLGGYPWKEDGQAKVNTLMKQAFEKWGDRWVWSFNVYSIWDVNMWPHSGGDCKAKTEASVSIEYTKNVLKTARQRIKATTGGDHNPMWVGENGWSSPMPLGHPKFPFCPDYDSQSTFRLAYENFLSWDLSLNDGLTGAEHAFYFTMRDSFNVGAAESFGLVARCDDTNCKIQSGTVASGETNRSEAASEIIV